MKIIKSSYEILTPITGRELIDIEHAGRTCYKSERNITDNSAKVFVAKLIGNGHEAMLEHSILSVKFVCDRGVSHELVRHRIASFAQESTRFCNYGGKEIEFIWPCFFGELSGENLAKEEVMIWSETMLKAEKAYNQLLYLGFQPQQARSVLPNSLKTEVIMTANYREWRNFFKLRALGTTGKPHPQMLELTVPLLKDVQKQIPVVFDDLTITD